MTKPSCLLSIIVPTLNEAETITATLQPLQMLRNQGCEIIIADGGSDDHTAEQAAPWVDQLVVTEKGRARQMNAGADLAQGRWLLFLHADTLLTANFSSFLISLASTEKQWGFFSLSLTGRHIFFRVIETAINLRSRLTSIGTGDQCLFVKKALFLQLGRFPEIALMEDVSLCKTLRQHSSPWVCIDKVLTSSRRWEQHGILKTVGLMWRLRLAYFLGASPDRLVKIYYGR
ncbi:MAG: TIGR04283 family arsenosugar biosynthesis glycosyltransferase [Oceanicoccus sp.]|uniref:TIGR04283 family arsenosugar biosynthesis glycosyltransferase n=1 Tax=Oceanicoccus sp. TaxID=2691044 RepID=UPI0026309BA9|nr:TIGR04283 family arsenosugar biosynthesis glycosyltransferase [Oceanicoccus sp.]MDG1772854.1 TIGR04283 family arsenosugar biosynthesis glycosyltransferase [Oceanicoccus sp.]